MIKKLIAFIVTLVMIISAVTSLNVFAADEPKISAKAAILIDASNGNILFEKNPDDVMFPASTTKVMTALVALEAVKNGEISLEQPLTFSQEAYDSLPWDGSSISLKVGEEMKLENLLQGLLIASGNDAALCIAEGVCDTVNEFVTRMNQKAEALKLKNTHFVNPHGLQDENHYTTVSDMAKIARAAMQNEEFRKIVECAHIYLPETNMSEKRYFINTNNLVSRMRYPYYYYDKATGIKTGSTSEAGYCLVSSAADGDKSVIAVVFNANDLSQSHNESKALLEYGLTGFNIKRLAQKEDIFGEVKVKQASDGTDHILLSSESNLEVLLPKDADDSKLETKTDIPDKVYAPIMPGQVIGKAEFSYDGKKIGEVNLVSTVKIKRHIFGFIMSFGEWLWSFRTVKVVVYLALGLAVAFIVLVAVGFAKALKKSKSKKRRTGRYTPPRY